MAFVSIITRNLLLEALRTQYAGYCVRVFGSPRREHPEDSIGAAVLLYTITNDAQPGVGLTFEVAADGTLVKTITEVWRGVGVGDGEKTWACMSPLSDTGAASTAIHRIDFSVGSIGDAVDFGVQDVIAVTGSEQKINFFKLTLAESVVAMQ